MWIAEFTNYKVFLRALIKTYPKAGYGQGRRLAEHLNVAPIVVSQILSRDRHFTADQAIDVAEFFGFDEPTTEYFIYLVNLERADTAKLKSFYQKKLAHIRAEAQKIKSLVQQGHQLSDLEKGIFYSNWYYCGVSLLTSIEGFNTVEAIATYFGLNRVKAGEVLSFLLATGLCTQEEGKLRMGTRSTHVPEGSPFVNNHRRNWREKALQKFSQPEPDDIFFSGPVSLSEKDVELMRKELLKVIKEFLKRVAASPEEKLQCLNIDWFGF